MRGSPSGAAVLLGMAFSAIVGLWSGGQYLAWRFSYHPNLGTPALELAGVLVYSPLRYPVWAVAYGRLPAFSGIVEESFFAVAAGTLVVFLPLVLLLRRRRVAKVGGSRGTAHWGDPSRLRDPDGLIVGAHAGRLLRMDTRSEPIVTIAPPGAGKGVGAVIPNLLDHPGAVVCLDPKGENHAVTARRRREMGQRVYALDPWELVGGGAAFNPMDAIDPNGSDALDDARRIAGQVVPPSAREGEDSHWDREAREWLAMLVLHVATTAAPPERHLPCVRRHLMSAGDEFEHLLAEMRDNDAAGGVVSRAGAAMLDRMARAPKEAMGVLTTARGHTHFLDSVRMARVLSRSTVDLEELRGGRLSLYLVFPTERMREYGAWVRLMVVSVLTALKRSHPRPGPPVLLLLDEVAQFGRIDPLLEAVTYLRGYGATLWLFFQSLSQLEGRYGKEGRTFLASAGLVQTFGINDLETAEHFSRLTGEATIAVQSENESRGVSGSSPLASHVQRGRAVTISEQARRLLTADEVRRLPRAEQLLFLRGMAPIRCAGVDYRNETTFQRQFDPNPMHGSAPLAAT